MIATLDEYVGHAMRTVTPLSDVDFDYIDYALIGLQSEIGELFDLYKRHIFFSEPINQINELLELGDSVWFVALLWHNIAVPAHREEDIIYLDRFRWVPVPRIKFNMHLCNRINNCASHLAVRRFDGGKEVDKDDVMYIIRQLQFLSGQVGTLLSTICEMNLKKINYRYSRFGNAFRFTRDLKTEHKLLEDEFKRITERV